MKTTATALRLQFDEKNYPELSLTLAMSRSEAMSKAHKLKEIIAKGKKLSVEVTEHRDRRSLDANAYCWVLCDKIAEVIRSTKEEVYQEVIRRVGVFTDVAVKHEAVESYVSHFSKQGIGNSAEVRERGESYTAVRSYFGSSTYDTKQMARLIDEIVHTAQELDIETRPEAEINSLLKEWNNA